MTVLQPFVWISAYTPNDPNTLKVIPLTSDVLLSFTDESVFDLSAADGSQRLRTGRLKVRFVIFDKDFTYWETLFVLNKRRLEIEYGWLNTDGTVATSSGKYAITLTQIGPKFTYQGTEIEVLGVNDLTSSVAPGSPQFFYASRTFSIVFLPDHIRSPYPDPLLSKPITQGQQNDGRIRLQVRRFQDAFDSGAVAVDDSRLVAVDPHELLSTILDPSKKVYSYSSISQLVKDIASQLGLKSDVDDTEPATNAIVVNGLSLVNILSRLATEAKSPTGDVDYRFWIRGDTIYFKRPAKSATKRRILEFNAQGYAIADSSAASSKADRTIVLSVDMKVNPTLLVSSSRAGVVTAAVDASNKVMRGGNVAPPWRNIKETLSKSITRKVAIREYPDGGGVDVTYETTYTPPEGMTIATAIKAEEEFYAQKWLLWDMAVELADPLVEEARASEKEYAKNINVVNIYSNSDFDNIRSQTRIAAFLMLAQQTAGRIADTGDGSAEADVNNSLYADAVKNPTSSSIRDNTLTGRLYPTAFQNEQAANLSKQIMHDVATKVIQAEVLCLGDVTFRLQQQVTLILSTTNGQHYASGNYLILGINNTIDSQGFTSKLTLVSNGSLAGSPELSGSLLDNKQPKPVQTPPQKQVWTDIKETDNTRNTITIDNFNEDFDRRLNRG